MNAKQPLPPRKTPFFRGAKDDNGATDPTWQSRNEVISEQRLYKLRARRGEVTIKDSTGFMQVRHATDHGGIGRFVSLSPGSLGRAAAVVHRVLRGQSRRDFQQLCSARRRFRPRPEQSFAGCVRPYDGYFDWRSRRGYVEFEDVNNSPEASPTFLSGLAAGASPERTMKYHHSLAMLVLFAGGALPGCTSVQSTYFYRNEDDTRWKKLRSKGIPITLDVPTHVRFNVIQRYLLVNGKPLRIPAPTVADPSRKVVYAARDVRYDLITEKKIFTVDMKRPAAGPYQNRTTFDNNQYFTQIDHRLEDKTIETVGTQINALVGKLLPTGGAAPGKATSTDFSQTKMIPLESVVCSQVFKLDAPDFEAQVAAFLQANCGSMTGIPVGPETDNQVLATLSSDSAAAGTAFAIGGKNVGKSGVDGRSGSPGPPDAAPVSGTPPAEGQTGPKPPAAPNSAATPTALTAPKPEAGRASSGALTSPIATYPPPVRSGPTLRSRDPSDSVSQSHDAAPGMTGLAELSSPTATTVAPTSIKTR
jgi:hypothetical protein